MSGQRGGKTLIITDDEEEPVQDEQNPFSFKEFLRWKDQDQDRGSRQPGSDVSSSSSLSRLTWQHRCSDVIGCCVCLENNLALNTKRTKEIIVDFRRHNTDHPLYNNGEQVEREEPGRSRSSSPCTEEEEEDEDDEEETRFSSQPDGAAGGENYEGDDETSVSEGPASCSKGRSQLQQLREENVWLRRSLREQRRRADLHQAREAKLSEELLQRRRQEEKEAQDLESMVQSVEQNLQLMTRRAAKAENSVSRLKAELQQLQVEAESLRAENRRLKAAETEVVMTMRQNAQTASEYLRKSAGHAHSSIRQLLQEAETLRLVSQLLQAIDRISTSPGHLQDA